MDIHNAKIHFMRHLPVIEYRVASYTIRFLSVYVVLVCVVCVCVLCVCCVCVCVCMCVCVSSIRCLQVEKKNGNENNVRKMKI